MKRNAAFVLAAVLAMAGGASALVRPEAGTALPDYDVRATLKGLLLGSAPGKFRARNGGAARPELSARQQELLSLLGARSNGDLVVRWGDLTASPRLVLRYQGPLTRPDWRDPALIARSFLQDYAELWGFEPAAIDAFEETRRFTTSNGGLTILELEQRVGGVSVFHGHFRFAFTADGEIAMVGTGSPIGEVTGIGLVPSLDAGEAVRFAADASGVVLASAPARINPASEKIAVFEKGPFQAEPTAEPVLFPTGPSARLGYKIYIQRADVPASYELIVDAADGTLLYRTNLVKYAQTEALVFLRDPGAAGQTPTRVQFWDNTVRVHPDWPLGWVNNDQTIGNVADSKEDWLGDDEATVGQRSADFVPGPPIFFEDPWTNGYESAGNAKRDARFVITNAFYYANAYHEWLYPYGFDEPSGNWQNDNYGRGGKGGDRVFVDVQDAYDIGQRNNANMATGPDGQSPRAQFYLFTASFFANRDSAVDGDVVFHELTHGLSHRLVGNADSANCLGGFQAGSMGEGWSDFYACAYYDDPVMGEYATGNATAGIRSFPYDAYPMCHNFNGPNFCSPNSCAGLYSAGCEVHDEGELWAAVLWEMRMNLIAADPTNGAAIALRLVTDGMKLTVCNPTFLDARDGILLADLYAYAGVHQCLIWESFKDRQMGWSATTTGGDDTSPNGASDDAPYCLTQGRVVLDLPSYGCGDTLVVTVQDGNATGPVSVQLSASSGDTLAVSAAGAAPIFSSSPIQIAVGAPAADAILQVQPGDTITAAYTDANPPASAQITAPVSCQLDVTSELTASGGCSADTSSWPTALPAILDAGEIVDFDLVVYNEMPRELTNVRVTLQGVSNPMVVPIVNVAGPVTRIAPITGSGKFRFTLGASRFLTPGTVTLDFLVEADGFTGTLAPVRHTVAVMSDYQVTSGSTGVEDFEASDGGYIHYPWPYAAPTDQWTYPSCAAASGTRAWGAHAAGCSGAAAEQDSNLETPLINPLGPTRVAWYPTALNWNHRLNLGTAGSQVDQVVIAISEPQIFAGGDFGAFALIPATQSTGAVFQPRTIAYTAADSTGLDTSAGLVAWFDFWTLSSGATSTEWIIDDVEMTYQAADAVAQTGAPACVQAGYLGSLTGSCGTASQFLYNTARPAEAQYAGNGSFWNVSPDWNAFDTEFPTPSAAGERLVYVSTANPNDAMHQGVLAVNGRTISTPNYLDFGPSTCADIPTPMGPASVTAGQPIILTWSPFAESGNVPAILGYRVWRLDAETWPAASSTITDYITNGVLVGSTVGNADINRFTDTAPPVATGTEDLYTYAIQPVLRCDPMPGCNLLPLTFGGSETSPGTANLSTDSAVVRVSRGLLAQFDSWSATRQGSAVLVRWSTLSEIDTIGFEVWRATTPDAAAMSKVSSRLIAGKGTHGGSYSFTDSTAGSGPVWYQIREVASNGTPSRTDVFGVSDAAGAARGGRGRLRGAAGPAGTRSEREGRLR